MLNMRRPPLTVSTSHLQLYYVCVVCVVCVCVLVYVVCVCPLQKDVGCPAICSCFGLPEKEEGYTLASALDSELQGWWGWGGSRQD